MDLEKDITASQTGGEDDEAAAGNEGDARDAAAVEKDLEAGRLNQTKTGGSKRSKMTKDPNLVTWDGPDDPENPKN